MKKFLALLFLVLATGTVRAAVFTVDDIRVEGLQRVSAGTVFGNFPVNVGDQVSSRDLAEASRRLFRTGFFTDIQLGRDGDVLVIQVVERPSIESITLDGNKSIADEDLLAGLEAAGLSEGQVFRRATSERLELEVLRSYVAQGRYNASVDVEAIPTIRNRVALEITISEGSVATIRHINFVGNEAFEDKQLRGLFSLTTPSIFTLFNSNEKYSRERLSGDLETLRSFYLDRGYLQFSIESTQVSITPDKESVFITVNIAEGPQFTVSDVRLSGDLVLPEEEVRALLLVREGQTFSRQLLTLTQDIISEQLGNVGYTFANVNAIPEPHDDNTATVTFFVDPGRRTYVRRVEFRGNTLTKDEVLRREMRQQEASPASNNRIEAGKRRLERTGFFSTVNVETPNVSSANDQIDVVYTVEEQPSGSLAANFGFSQSSGFILGASISENNYLGSGNRVSFGVNRSESIQSASLAFTDPFFTVDGVSRGFSVSFRQTDFEELEISSFTTDTLAANVTFGYPINNISRLNFGFGFENTNIDLGVFPLQEIIDFVEEDGEQFNFYNLNASYVRSTLNRGLFPTRGLSTSIGLEFTVPEVSDLEFYRIRFSNDYYRPITRNQRWVLHLRSEVGFGDGFADTDSLPFFENFFAGGLGSVRGFDDNSLGPLGTPTATFDDDDPFGGNLLIESSAEIIFPLPFVGNNRSVRSTFFFDAGNVFDTESEAEGSDVDLNELRTSIGIQISWITAIAPLTFSLARPINDEPGDDTETFQFSLGQTF